MSAPAGPLAPDLVAALKRLKLARVRAIAPEVLATAKTQRWAPEEVLRTLVEAEIAARDEANERNRLRVAGFPVTKTLEGFQRAHSSIPAQTLDYLGSLEWIAAAENLCLVGPAGLGSTLPYRRSGLLKQSSPGAGNVDAKPFPAALGDLARREARPVGPCATRSGGPRRASWPPPRAAGSPRAPGLPPRLKSRTPQTEVSS